MDVQHAHVLHAVEDVGQAAAPVAVDSSGGFVLSRLCLYICIVDMRVDHVCVQRR